jgi:rsbT antagonist protein RsbS
VNEHVPVVKIGRVLIASIPSDLGDDTALLLQEDLSNQIVEHAATGVIIDISALDIVDTFIARMLATIASVSRVLDALTIVVGMRPAVAITLTELGLTLGGVRTAINGDRAFEILRSLDVTEEEDDLADLTDRAS